MLVVRHQGMSADFSIPKVTLLKISPHSLRTESSTSKNEISFFAYRKVNNKEPQLISFTLLFSAQRIRSDSLLLTFPGRRMRPDSLLLTFKCRGIRKDSSTPGLRTQRITTEFQCPAFYYRQPKPMFRSLFEHVRRVHDGYAFRRRVFQFLRDFRRCGFP